MTYEIDASDRELIGALRARAGACRTPICRGGSGWPAARCSHGLARLVDVGVITGWGPDLDARATDHSVTAFITLSIAQGAHNRVVR